MTDIAIGLDLLVPGALYRGSVTKNTQAAFDSLVWEDGRAKPEWNDIVDAALTEELQSYATQKRYDVEVGGIVFGGMSVPTDDRAKTLVSGAAGSSGLDTDIVKFKVGGAWIDLTLAQVRAIQDAIVAHVQSCFAVEASVSGDIASGTITTTAQIDSAAWPSNN